MLKQFNFKQFISAQVQFFVYTQLNVKQLYFKQFSLVLFNYDNEVRSLDKW